MNNILPNIKERALYIAELKGITRKYFCNKIGMSYGNFTGEAKKTPINSNAIGNILSNFPDISPDWLVSGNGNILRENPADGEKKKQKNDNAELDVLTKEIKRLSDLLKLHKDIHDSDKKTIETQEILIDLLKRNEEIPYEPNKAASA